MTTAVITWIKKHQLITFFFLSYLITAVFVFAWPTQSIARWTLPWILNVTAPTISALVVSWIIGGLPEVKRIVSGYTRWKVGFFWYFAAAFLFLGPLAVGLVYRALGNPATHPVEIVTFVGWVEMLAFQMLSGPASEELGWRGFALPRLQTRHNALVSSLILGVIHACWHFPLFFVPGSSQAGIPFPIYVVLVTFLTVYFTWIYNNAKGSLIVAILAHFAFDATGLLVGPLGLMPPILQYAGSGALLALIVIGIVIVYGPRTLSKKPVADLPFEREAQPAKAAFQA